MSTYAIETPSGASDAAPELTRRTFEVRALKSMLLSALVWALAIIASIPLFTVLYMLLVHGGARLNWETLTELPPAGFEDGGGFGNAIVGTFAMVGIAAAISVPIGILCATFLAELGPDSRLATAVRFAAKTLTGFPSILAGVFAYASVVLLTGGYSAPAGGAALAVLMVPTVILTAEEAMKMVPKIMRDAAYGMGCTRTQVILKVTLPTALPGVLTGVMLAVARAAGETAPLLFTAFNMRFMSYDLHEPISSLTVQIYTYAKSPNEDWHRQAWAGALVLVGIVFICSVFARIATRRLERMHRA